MAYKRLSTGPADDGLQEVHPSLLDDQRASGAPPDGAGGDPAKRAGVCSSMIAFRAWSGFFVLGLINNVSKHCGGGGGVQGPSVFRRRRPPHCSVLPLLAPVLLLR